MGACPHTCWWKNGHNDDEMSPEHANTEARWPYIRKLSGTWAGPVVGPGVGPGRDLSWDHGTAGPGVGPGAGPGRDLGGTCRGTMGPRDLGRDLSGGNSCEESAAGIRGNFQNALSRFAMMKMAAAVSKERTIRPSLSCRRSRRLFASSQAQPCSTTHRTLPSPEPWGSPTLRMCG